MFDKSIKNIKLASTMLAAAAFLASCGGGGGGGGHGGGGGGGGGDGPLTLPPVGTFPAGCLLATVGQAYSCDISVSGGTAPYTFASATGLPAGITSSQSGQATATLSGTPTPADVAGGRGTKYTVMLCVTDATSAQVCLGTQAQPLQITVNPAANALAITTQSPLPYAYVGANYAQALGAAGGALP